VSGPRRRTFHTRTRTCPGCGDVLHVKKDVTKAITDIDNPWRKQHFELHCDVSMFYCSACLAWLADERYEELCGGDTRARFTSRARDWAMRRLREKKMKRAEIAACIGATPSTITVWAKAAGITRPPSGNLPTTSSRGAHSD